MDKESWNVFRMSLSFMIFFTADLSLVAIQEPLIAEFASAGVGNLGHHDGYLSLFIIYLVSTLSCFFAPYFVTRVSGKWSVVLGMIFITILQFFFLFPSRIFLLISSVLLGFGVTLTWIGQGQYISENVSEKTRERNTSYQWALFKMALIFGGIFFYVFFEHTTMKDAVSNGKVALLIYVFMGCTVVALLNTILLPQSKISERREKQSFLQVSVNCLKLFKTRRIICLSVFYIYSGFVRAFWLSIFPACIKFTSTLASDTSYLLAVGMIVTGVGQVLGSLIVMLVAKRIRKLGEHVVVISGLVLHIAVFIAINLCFPNDAPLEPTNSTGLFKANIYVAMIICFFLGFGDAVIQTQIYAQIAKYYQQESGSLFSIYRFFSGVATTIIFFSAHYFTLICHVILLIVFALASIVAIQKSNVVVQEDKVLSLPGN